MSFLLKQSALAPAGSAPEPSTYILSFDPHDEDMARDLWLIFSSVGVTLLLENHLVGEFSRLELKRQRTETAREILLCVGADAVQERLDDLLFQLHADVRKIRPVLLPGASDKDVPNIFQSANWLDLREGVDPVRVQRFAALHMQP